jgi:hypothetical protein
MNPVMNVFPPHLIVRQTPIFLGDLSIGALIDFDDSGDSLIRRRIEVACVHRCTLGNAFLSFSLF